jgi:nucleoside-diphosphate-sugar epimerase
VDFEANVVGTLNVLEAARAADRPPIVAYASTNKVYGPLDDVPLVPSETRYSFRDLQDGISEERPLAFDSPYACSKGAGEQYALAAEWRPGDQRVFYADVSRARRELGWESRTTVEEGLRRLSGWIAANSDALAVVAPV